MFWLPESTQEAVWMQAPLTNGGFKWWIAAVGDQLITLWGDNGVLKQGKVLADDPFTAREKYREKQEEKLLVKKYTLFAQFTTATGWIHKTPTNILPPYLPRPRGFVKKHTEGQKLLVRLFDGNVFYLDLRLLELSGPDVGSGTCGQYRLDHYETVNKHSSGKDFPLFQTRYDDVQEALDAIVLVAGNREKKGFHKVDVSGATNLADFILKGTPLEVQVAVSLHNINSQFIIEGAAGPEIWIW